MQNKYNNPEIKLIRKILRNNATPEERLLWSKLRMKRMGGYKFVRQYSVGRFVLDFYCPKAKLAVELDGSQHDESRQYDYDRVRTRYLEGCGIKILRFWNSEVKYQIEAVLDTIFDNLDPDRR